MKIKNKHAVALGRLGGSRATEAQKRAARKNGLRPVRPGSRPRGRPEDSKNKKHLTNPSDVVLLG